MRDHMQYPDFMRSFFTIIICIVFGMIGGNCIAQQVLPKNDSAGYDFLPRKKVIFEDNFSQDAIGAFPSKWRILGDGTSHSPRHCQVKKEGDDFILVTSGAISDIEPKINREPYLADSFTLEYDFMLGAPEASIVIDFRTKYSKPRSFDWFTISGNGDVFYLNLNNAGKVSDKYPGALECNVWHHLAISNKNGMFKLYIDQYHLLTVPIYYGSPLLSFGLHCNPVGKYRNIRLATGGESSLSDSSIDVKKSDSQATESLKVTVDPEDKSLIVNVSSAVKEDAQITVTNRAGKKVKEMMTTTNVDTEIELDAPAGLYFILAVIKNKTLTAKVVVE